MASMARVSTHTRVFPLVSPGRHLESKENIKPRRCVKMTYRLQAPVLRIQTITGLRACNALNLMSRSREDLFSKVNISISSHNGRASASRCVTKAIFDFERCTEETIKVIMLAQEEATSLGHNEVGTQQLLLGLIREETGIAAKVLTSIGINLDDTRTEVEKITGRGSGFEVVEVIPFTPLAVRVLKISQEEAKKHGPNYSIGTEHILIGILSEGNGVAARVLENLGADSSQILTQVIHMVDKNRKKQTLEEY